MRSPENVLPGLIGVCPDEEDYDGAAIRFSVPFRGYFLVLDADIRGLRFVHW